MARGAVIDQPQQIGREDHGVVCHGPICQIDPSRPTAVRRAGGYRLTVLISPTFRAIWPVMRAPSIARLPAGELTVADQTASAVTV